MGVADVGNVVVLLILASCDANVPHRVGGNDGFVYHTQYSGTITDDGCPYFAGMTRAKGELPMAPQDAVGLAASLAELPGRTSTDKLASSGGAGGGGHSALHTACLRAATVAVAGAAIGGRQQGCRARPAGVAAQARAGLAGHHLDGHCQAASAQSVRTGRTERLAATTDYAVCRGGLYQVHRP